MKKYYKIGEISKLYGIGVDSLRYYEKLNIISPRRSEKGYRLYSVSDIWKLNVIRELRQLNFGMEDIKKYIKNHNLNSTVSLLKDEEKAIEEKLYHLKDMQKKVKQRMENINNLKDTELNRVKLKEFDDRKCYYISQGYKYEEEMDVLIKKLLNMDEERLYVIGNNNIGTVIKFEGENKITYDSVFLIDKKGNKTIKKGKYLTLTYKGEYGQSKYFSKVLLNYAKENNLSPCGDILEILKIDIHTTDNVQEFLTELQLPVK